MMEYETIRWKEQGIDFVTILSTTCKSIGMPSPRMASDLTLIYIRRTPQFVPMHQRAPTSHCYD